MVKFNASLLPYQEVGVNFIHKSKRCLIGDEPGLGKTIQALKACFDMGFKTLIICPAYLRTNWINEIAKFCPSLSYVVCSYSQTKPYPSDVNAVILDESSYIKSTKSQRTMRVHRHLRLVRPKYVILLNGSPIKNRVEDLYSQLALISPDIVDQYPSIWAWLNKFSNRTIKRYGLQEYIKYEGHKNTSELKELLSKYMIRRKADSVLELPPVNQRKVIVSYGNDDKLQKEWDVYVKGHARDSKAKKESAIRKSLYTGQFVYDLVVSDTFPIVVYSCHPEAVDKIAEYLSSKKLRVRKITGLTKMDSRSEIVKELQDGDIEVVVASLLAFNTGWTGTKSNTMVFNDISWVPEDNVQAAKRIHRIGQDRPVFYHFIVGSKVDETILDANLQKKSIIQAVLN